MLRYVDSVILIYYLDRADSFHQRAKAWLATMLAQSDDLAVSDLSRLECRVGPIKRSDDVALALFDGFFQRSDVRTVPLTTGVFDRATLVRATFNFKTADSLHLAASVESGCQSFLTNDVRLTRYTDIPVEVMP